MKKKPKYNENAVIRGALRRQFARSPIVREVMGKVRREVPKYNKDGSRAKKDAVQYRCGPCGQWTKSTAISVDHISPVVAVEDGFVDWNQFIARLFCGPENLQVICDTCHNEKTNGERIARLTKQYTDELDILEEHLTLLEQGKWTNNPDAQVVAVNDAIKKYTAKKKTIGLEPVVQRACRMKERIAPMIIKPKRNTNGKSRVK